MGLGPQAGLNPVSTSQVVSAIDSVRAQAGLSKTYVAGTPTTVSAPASGTISALSDVVDISSIFQGDAFAVDSTTGFLVAQRDMRATVATLSVIADVTNGETVAFGFGIGDPDNIPSSPGSASGNNYVSRFYGSHTGVLSNRKTSYSISGDPMGRDGGMSGIGISEGDLIFPVIWSEETSAVDVDIYDFIMSLEEIRA